MPEHEVGRGLVRGREQDRAHEAVPALQVPQHLVASANARPAGGIDVQREHRQCLRHRLVCWGVAVSDQLDGAVGGLAHRHCGTALPALDREHQDDGLRVLLQRRPAAEVLALISQVIGPEGLHARSVLSYARCLAT